MSSLVCFPFKDENVKVFSREILEAASHPRVAEVLCVGKERNLCYEKMEELIPKIEKKTGREIRMMTSKRLGQKSPYGKGEALNTGLKFFLNETDYERIHFYDSDILTFSKEWITKAELKADEGFQVVRHYYPRASTDAMITWHITKTGFAILWPKTELVKVEQPLGGELLLTRQAIKRIFGDVVRYSDWSVDTAYTWFSFFHRLPFCEVYEEAGKLHRLYRGLTDLKTMLIECFSIFPELKDRPLETSGIRHEIEAPTRVPEGMKTKIAYDIEKTLVILKERWTDKQAKYLEYFPEEVKNGMNGCRNYPLFSFMNEKNWYEVYKIMLKQFDEKDNDWRELLFKFWVSRVLNYTMYEALKGYDHAISYLSGMITRYGKMSTKN